jgi:hypothetical protein
MFINWCDQLFVHIGLGSFGVMSRGKGRLRLFGIVLNVSFPRSGHGKHLNRCVMIMSIVIMFHDLKEIVKGVLERLLHVLKASAFVLSAEDFGDLETVQTDQP